ncbi:MAG: hypothetical protein IKY52_09060, partial [Clostridia bacterium]|nr:hypothetical protein [Clostridia bacterium]
FPSGQRGQTVNLLALPSVVRIHLPPFKTKDRIHWIWFFVLQERCMKNTVQERSKRIAQSQTNPFLRT